MAFVEICLLWMAILATSFFFRRVYPLAAGLLLPYLLWVTFAAALNFTIWRLNIGIN
jgi:tryptophan-rich sensory protein